VDYGSVVGTSQEAIELHVLGPVEARRDDRPLRLGGRRQRALLALLLLEPGRPVSVDVLMEELWAGAPPHGAAKSLRVYISRLRSALVADIVVARAPGYALDIDADRIDATRFERLLREGRDALERGATGSAADRLEAALALWRGPAFADVADEGLLAREAQRLDELRLVAREELIEAQLALGHHAECVSELEQLVAEQPLRERLWRQLVLALYRCGRQADALHAYRRARSLLRDELGLEPTEELRDLERAVLRQEVAGATVAEARHNLPARVTSFVGRERELSDLARLLREHRLITVTGPGGAGKTSLALATASRRVGSWSDGTWLVDLIPLSDPELVPSAAATTLGIAERSDTSPLDALVEGLARSELLLVLDNCEHVVAGCALLAAEVIRRCPEVRVLATSRVPLGVDGEIDFTLEPLAIPAEAASADEIEQLSSTQLFLDRSRAVRRDVVVEAEGLITVGRICRELDGLPLAIELAAAHARMLSVTEIASRLDDRMRFLRSWRRVADARHQTLRTTIDWSYDLLAEDERALLAQLSVFAGGFTLDAVTAVCLEEDDARVLELLGRLVESSLVVAEERSGATRYRLLVTIREFADEHLDDSSVRDLVSRRHAEYFLDVAARASWSPLGFSQEQQRQGLAVFDAERDNLHAAMEWTLVSASDLALPLAVALRNFWNIRGYRRQGVEWFERALASPRQATDELRAKASSGAALLARLSGDFDRAQRFAEEAIALGRRADVPMAMATAFNVLTTIAGLKGDLDRARARSEESVAIARKAQSLRGEALATFIFAEAALNCGRHAEAVEAGDRALELARTVDDREVMSLALGRMGMAALHEERLVDARDRLLEAIGYARELGFAEAATWACDGLALVAARWKDAPRAARLLGAADALRRAGGVFLQPSEVTARNAARTAIQEALAEDVLEAELDRGRRMTLDEAAEEAAGVAEPLSTE
jgi:predicted ATPase/DNA-binding SARP family transcriptional activator